MRQFIFPVLFCVAAAQATAQTPVSNASASTGSASPSVIRDAAQSGVLNGLRWPRFPYYRDELTSLYTAAGWRPLWTLNGRPTPAARSAIDALRSAQDRGLHPEDYDAAKLDQQFRKLSSGAASPRDVRMVRRRAVGRRAEARIGSSHRTSEPAKHVGANKRRAEEARFGARADRRHRAESSYGACTRR